MDRARWRRPPSSGIRRLDAGSWFAPRFAGAHVPSFREALELVRDLGLGANIEIKPCPGREAETAERAVALIAGAVARPAAAAADFQLQAGQPGGR